MSLDREIAPGVMLKPLLFVAGCRVLCFFGTFAFMNNFLKCALL